ncbi:MAG: hypothetical protein QN141_05670 [Armatimonadota bacterium]|nr:hypothetical protein [Armatimonadota bacterium]MDR7452211.1 hypothetical protein [Armatimonadota bacterium]MDR7466694.1 hypothetical protein [Armatimonadota bacterium]MDR7492832.1 hypothetical protein [Armatimonadota bacterium]MDR7498608.1 hypothetical protein [Armatimonadota bacterium]
MVISTLHRLTAEDLRYIVTTLYPGADPHRVAARLRDDDQALERHLEDERLLRRILGESDILIHISPWLLFGVLLRHVRRVLLAVPYTIEEALGERVPVFDAVRAGELLADRDILDYLVLMLVSFTRTETWAIEVEQEGRRRWRRFSDLDSDDMIALAGIMPEALRFPILRRIGDIALFTSGIFPEAVDRRAGGGGGARAARKTLEEYEEEGRLFYRLAAQHEVARRTGWDRPLEALAETFPIARKPLNVLASQYIRTSRLELFGEFG